MAGRVDRGGRPVVRKPVASKPVVSKPVVSKPVVSKPVVSKPVVSKPVLRKPAVKPPATRRTSRSSPGKTCYRAWEPGLNPNVSKVRNDHEAYLRNILGSSMARCWSTPVSRSCCTT